MRNERGSILMALLIGMGLLAAIVGLFAIFDSAHFDLNYAKKSSDLAADVSPLADRVALCLTHLDTATCPPPPFDLAAARDTMALANTAVTPIVFTYADLQALGLSNVYAGAGATVNRIMSPDDIWYGSTSISLVMNITPTGASRMAPRTINRTYRVSLSSPVSWGLITRPAAGATAISLNGSQLKVYGGLLDWTATPAISPTEIVSATDAPNFWSDHIDLKSMQLNTSSSATDQVVFNQLRALGLRTNSLPGVWNPFGAAEWQQQLDYAYVYQGGGFPLPAGLSPVASMGDKVPNDASDARAAVAAFPDATVMNGKGLETTCERPSDFQKGSSHALILTRAADSLSFDYNDTANPANFACGLVMAAQVTINTRPGQTVVWYGHINTQQLTLTGGGTLVIVNPFDPLARPTDLPAPSDMSLADMAETDLSLASSTAFNFFVPFVTAYANLPANLHYRMYSSLMEPCLGGTRQCWPFSIDPPNLSAYLNTCGTAPCWYSTVRMSMQESL